MLTSVCAVLQVNVDLPPADDFDRIAGGRMKPVQVVDEQRDVGAAHAAAVLGAAALAFAAYRRRK